MAIKSGILMTFRVDRQSGRAFPVFASLRRTSFSESKYGNFLGLERNSQLWSNFIRHNYLSRVRHCILEYPDQWVHYFGGPHSICFEVAKD